MKKLIVLVLSALLFAQQGALAAKPKPRGPGLPLIRDAEIEGLLRLYTKPIFGAAGINARAVKVYIIKDARINAFVAGGQRIFVNTGTLMQAKTPNQVIGVLAHETGHIAGAHLARMGIEVQRASIQSLIGMLAGAAAIVGGAATGSQEVSKAGQGVMLGSQGLVQRNFLSYQRSMEASADQAALKYLNTTGQSAKGMLEMFKVLANASIASAQFVDPYAQSHPMPFDRIRNLEVEAKKSPYFDKPDPPELMLRHKLMQAKLTGFLQPASVVYQRYPISDNSLPARYARAIAMFRGGDLKNALPVINSLIKDVPQDPYFWELKGQALVEGGRAPDAIAPLKEANRLLPNNGLVKLLYAQALLGSESPADAKTAITLLKEARRTEGDTPQTYSLMAMGYGILNDVPHAELATAESAVAQGDKELALEKAKSAAALFKQGSPEWLRANDILNLASRK